MPEEAMLPSSGSYAKLVEVSHGSASDQSPFLGSKVLMLRNLRHVVAEILMFFVCLALAIILFLAWFVDFPVLSRNLKDHSRFSVPISITALISLTVISFVCLWRICFVVGCCGSTRRRRTPSTVAASVAEESPGREHHRSTPRHHRKQFAKLCNMSDEALSAVKEIASSYARDSTMYVSQLVLSAPNVHATEESLVDSLRTESSQGISSYDISAKVALIGATNAGKTSIFHRILYNSFSDCYVSTLGVDVGFTTLNLLCESRQEQLNLGLQLWDVAGSEQSSGLSSIAYKDALAFIIVFDVTDVTSFEHGLAWLRDIKTKKYDPYVAMFSNKVDKDCAHRVRREMQAACGESAVDVFHVSARTGDGISDSFIEVATRALAHEINKLI